MIDSNSINIFGRMSDPTDYPGRFKTSKFIQEGFSFSDMQPEKTYVLKTEDDGEMDLYFLAGISIGINKNSCCINSGELITFKKWKDEFGIK